MLRLSVCLPLSSSKSLPTTEQPSSSSDFLLLHPSTVAGSWVYLCDSGLQFGSSTRRICESFSATNHDEKNNLTKK